MKVYDSSGLCGDLQSEAAWVMSLSPFPPTVKQADQESGCLLTLSLPIPLRFYTLPYWSNPPFLIFRTERQSVRMSKIKNGGLDQYGAEPFEQQQFGTAGVEGVNPRISIFYRFCSQNL